MLGERFSEVLDAARAGEEQAFALLYRDLNANLLRYFFAHAPSEAEDLASEAWLAAARGLRSFEGDERAFRAWLFTIAHRKVVQHWRDAARHPAQPAPQEVFDAVLDASETERQALDASDAAAAARALAAALSPDQAQVVLLRVLGGLTVEEVAAAMGKRPGTVRVLQHRALRRLAGKFSLEGVTR
ncbi:MAG: sigma-70 family RNA polymerase sigma factor [Actinomycetota bacterium]|jgi:RNA polymerase sigma-70 factor (ECF subfamily)|nr:sigma-70 family RNA polymerase sigma factor [Actinomycetota bacterium]